MNIQITHTEKKKVKPELCQLGFGKIFTDHMFIMEYTEGMGWHDERIVPYQSLTLDPATAVFHYGQEMFEGLKAYRNPEGEILLFRPEKNGERLNITNERICIPKLPVDDFLEAVKAIVDVDQEWIPEGLGNALYIRPYIIATDPFLGVHPSKTYKFIIILSPVGSYYKEGINPVKIWVEDEYVRAVPGGIGYAKTGGNYVASIKAQANAEEKGYTQVLWLDGIQRKYIEEVGAMNVFFKVDGRVITPSLTGSILEGITRGTVIELLKMWGIDVSEERISIDDLIEYRRQGKLEEAFGTGTAAVISPIGELGYKDYVLEINHGKIGVLSQKIYDVLTGIQTGKIKDTFGWTMIV